jgi:adenine phosphoribosyltransferase
MTGRKKMTPKKIDLKKFIRLIPNWPKKGVLFRDITPLLANADAFSAAVKALCAGLKRNGVDYVVAVEARGFIFGAAVAEKLSAGFIPVRKQGKLPFDTEDITYDLEYGTDSLEIHIDAMKKGSKVLMVDDLLATGGTMAAACKLVEKLGGKILAISFLVELADLNGRKKLKKYKVKSLMSF